MATSNTQPAFPIEKEIKITVVCKNQEDLNYLAEPNNLLDDIKSYIEDDLLFEVKSIS